MARSKKGRHDIMGWALGVGAVLVILFALFEYGFGMREFATGENEDPAITDTTISDTELDNDPAAIERAETADPFEYGEAKP